MCKRTYIDMNLTLKTEYFLCMLQKCNFQGNQVIFGSISKLYLEEEKPDFFYFLKNTSFFSDYLLPLKTH